MRLARVKAGLGVLTLALSAVGMAQGQEPELAPRGIQLTISVRDTLSRLQDQWLLWNSAFLQGDQAAAGGAIDELLATAAELGMSRLPDLSLGILVRAVEAAREGDTERARWGMGMAERLDPGRPEAAFARARVAFIDGSYVEAGLQRLLGYGRLVGPDLLRSLWLRNAALFALAVLLLSGGLFVALQMATKGGALYRDLSGMLAGHLPSFAAYLLAVLILCWPLFLPRGWVWLVLYWAALVWVYASRSERWVLGVTCVLFGLAPVAVLQLQQGLNVTLSEPLRAVDSLADGRLYGEAFRDVEVLRSTLPGSNAVRHLIADLHVTLGQDELARPYYLGVVEEEPENVGALVNLGCYHYHRREYIKAIEYFTQAVDSEADRLEAHYNLSQSYRQLLEFGNADNYLEESRRLDANQVNDWVTQRVTVVPARDGFERRNEIRAELVEQWVDSGSGLQGLMSRGGSLPVALGALILAFALQALRKGARQGSLPKTDETFIDRWSRILLPGLEAAEEGAGFVAFASIALVVAAVLLPLSGVLGYRIPWGYDPGNGLAWVLAILLIFSYTLVRLRYRRG